jgi:hypothetical protein
MIYNTSHIYQLFIFKNVLSYIQIFIFSKDKNKNLNS